VFPFDGSTNRVSPSLHWVLRGRVSQLQRYCSTLRLPFTHTQRLMDSPLGSSVALDSLGQERERFLPPGSWIDGPAPRDRRQLGIKGPHRFLGCPSCAYALLFDPGRTSTPHQLGVSVLPPYPIRRRLQRGTISGLNHTASAPAVYASWPALLTDARKTRLRPVVNLYREGVEPSGHQQRFLFTNCP
jgi:hypothetical protein